jgi:GMP synthase (glutamine-hydrolysing)
MKRFLILQLRPETEAADNEFEAFLAKGRLRPDEVLRLRLDQEALPAELSLDDYAGVIVGGGPGCVSDPEDRKDPVEKRIEDAILGLMPEICARDMPFLGCCYGIGILGHHLAPGIVSKERYGEPVGAVNCALTAEGRADPLLAGVPEQFRAFVGHKEAVQALPPGTVALVSSGPTPFQMLRHGQNVYATQFHPEADADGFETRIRIYRHRGYFPPGEAEALTARVRAEDVRFPERILANFVRRYRAAEGPRLDPPARPL